MESKEREGIQEGNYPNFSNKWKKGSDLSNINGERVQYMYLQNS